MTIIALTVLCFAFYIAVITAIFDVQSFGFKTSTGGTDGTTNTIALTLWFNHTIYFCAISSPSRDTKYSCSSSQYTIQTSRCNTPKYRLLIFNQLGNDSVTLDNVFVTTKTGITYGINSICISDADTLNIGSRYADFLVSNTTNCSSGYKQYNKICIDQTSECYPHHQRLFFDITKPNKYISNALWNGTFVFPHIITCDPTMSTTISPTNIPSKNPTFMPTYTATPTFLPTVVPTSLSPITTFLPTATPTSLSPTFFPTVSPFFRSTTNTLETLLSEVSNVMISTENIGDNSGENSVNHSVENMLIIFGVLIAIFVILFCVYLVYRCKTINDKIDELNFDNHYVKMNDDYKTFNQNENAVLTGSGFESISTVHVGKPSCDTDIVEAVNVTDMGFMDIPTYKSENNIVETSDIKNDEFVIEEYGGIVTEGEENNEFVFGSVKRMVTNGIDVDGVSEGIERGIAYETIVGYDIANNDNESISLHNNLETIQ